MPGQIRNVYTKNDWILLLFTITEMDWSMGRNAVFEKNSLKHRNFDYDNNKEKVTLVAHKDVFTFRLKNYNIWSLASENFGGVGHMSYR